MSLKRTSIIHILLSLNLYGPEQKEFGYWKTNDVIILLEKIKSLISGQPQKEKPIVKPNLKKGKGSSKCSHHFGYLASLPKFESVPQECLTCQKLLECKNTQKT